MAGSVGGDGAGERFIGGGGGDETVGAGVTADVAGWRETFPPVQVGVPAVLRDDVYAGDSGEFHRNASFRGDSRGSVAIAADDRG